MVICLVHGADMHVAQLMPLPLSVSSVKSRLVLPFWYRLTPVVPGKWPLNGCLCVYASEAELVRMSAVEIGAERAKSRVSGSRAMSGCGKIRS